MLKKFYFVFTTWWKWFGNWRWGAVEELNALDDRIRRNSTDASVRQDVPGGELDTDSIALPSNGSTDITSDNKSEEEWGIDCSYFNNVKSNFEARR